MENDIFPCLVQERRREIENGEENFPSRPTFFYPPNLGGNGEEKVLNDILYTNILTLFLSPVNDYYYFFPLFPEVFNLHTTHI